AAQSADYRKSAGDQQDHARLRRSPARREQPADQPRGASEVAMTARLAGLFVVVLAFAAGAQEKVAEPSDYRTDDYRSAVPATLAGARVLTTSEAEGIWRAKSGVFIDVLPRAPKPKNLPEGTVWRDKPRFNIPGSIWLPDTGYGRLAPATEDYLRRGVARASEDNKNALIVVYCLADCWMSWNAAKRLLSYGYPHVAGYPEGTAGWDYELLPLVEAQPEPRPDE